MDKLRIFIWTEAIGCGEIIKPMLSSYLANNTEKIHVFIYEEDIELVSQLDLTNVIPITIPKNSDVEKLGSSIITEDRLRLAYKYGHKGTALLWAHIIRSRKEEILIHIDSDTIILGDIVSPLVSRLNDGIAIVGTRRPYRYNLGNLGLVKKLQYHFRPDAINTHCFGFRRDLVPMMDIDKLSKYIQGGHQGILKKIFVPVIDFFDNLTFILRKIGGIYYLDSYKQSKSGKHNRFGPFESSMISFSGVGSGCVFYKNNSTETAKEYMDFCLKSYALFSKLLLNRDLDLTPLKSEYLESSIANLDQVKWKKIV